MRLEITFTDGSTEQIDNVLKFKPIEGEAMNFSEAVKALKMGNKVRRLGWPEGAHISMLDCIGNRVETIRVTGAIGSCTTSDGVRYYNPTIEDLESNDWWLVV